MLLLALAVTRTTVKEITLVDEDCEHAVSVTVFRMSQPQARNLADSFQCLRTICFDIPEGSTKSLTPTFFDPRPTIMQKSRVTAPISTLFVGIRTDTNFFSPGSQPYLPHPPSSVSPAASQKARCQD